MQHDIPTGQLYNELGPQVVEMSAAVEACVHCGFCLPVCPTYKVLGEEMDSPRGRILLMKSVLEGRLKLQEMSLYIDRCLGCYACMTTCPSGVKYSELVGPFKAYAARNDSSNSMKHIQRRLIQETLPFPGRFRLAVTLGKLAQPIKRVLPREIKTMLELIPEKMPDYPPLPKLVPAEGRCRARVAFLTGCVQQVIDPAINWATVRVLAVNGVEIVIPEKQSCCGSLLIHMGEYERARELARQNLVALAEDVEYIVTNAAGCGSGMKEYGLLFKGYPEEHKARLLEAKVIDVSEFLIRLGIKAPPPLNLPLRISYHDPCHLAHAQGITSAPRKLLCAIPNLTLVDIADWETCCGSAGTYNIEQPEIAAQLGKMKAAKIRASGADVVVTGNIGCMVQIRRYLGDSLPVYHMMQVLEEVYRSQ